MRSQARKRAMAADDDDDQEDIDFRAQIISSIEQIDLSGPASAQQQDDLFVQDNQAQRSNRYWLEQQQLALNADDDEEYWANGQGFADDDEEVKVDDDDSDDDASDDNSSNADSEDSNDPEGPGSPGLDRPWRPPGWDDIWINGDGKRLPEHPYAGELIGYPEEAFDEETKTVQSYVEVKPGQMITIGYRIAPDHPYRRNGITLRYAFYLDGDDKEDLLDRHMNNSKYMYPKKEYWEDQCEAHKTSYKPGPKKNRRQPRNFEPMQIADIILRDDEKNEKKKKLGNHGTFIVKVWRVSSRKARGAKNNPMPRAGDRVHSVKSIKARSADMGVQFHPASGPALPRTFGARPTFDQGDAPDEPYMTRIFHYRNLQSLKTLHVVPRTPSPSRSPSPTPIARRIKRESPQEWDDEEHVDSADDDELIYRGRRSIKKQRYDLTQDDAEDERLARDIGFAGIAQDSLFIDMTDEPDDTEVPQEIIDLTGEDEDDIECLPDEDIIFVSSRQIGSNVGMNDDRADSAIGTPMEEQRQNPCVVM